MFEIKDSAPPRERAAGLLADAITDLQSINPIDIAPEEARALERILADMEELRQRLEERR